MKGEAHQPEFRPSPTPPSADAPRSAGQHWARASFSVLQAQSRGRGGRGAERKRKADAQGKGALPGSPARLRSLSRKCCCCSGRDGFKVTSRSGSACGAGPQDPRSQCGGRGALHGVWRYSARRRVRDRRRGPPRGCTGAARRGGRFSSSGPQGPPPDLRASGSVGVSLLFGPRCSRPPN